VPTLSICIPTYKRSQCLAELLDSIAEQQTPELQVVISDDASPDDTAAVVERYRTRFHDLRFVRQPVNIGLDRNFRAVVDAADGDYVWLMGDDDRLEPRGLRLVLDALQRWPGIAGLTVGVIDYDPTMAYATGIRQMPPTQRIEGVSKLFANLAELLGFISALVVKREMWQQFAHAPESRAYENYYLQVYLVGRVVERYGDWGVVQEPCVGFRTSNDQFLGKFGWRKRLEMDVFAYDQLAEGLFANDVSTRHAMVKRVFESHVMARLINGKAGEEPGPSFWETANFLFPYYKQIPAYWTRGLPMLLAPKWLVRGSRAAYKRWSKSSGAARARVLVRS
jgi:abequosyltransferase